MNFQSYEFLAFLPITVLICTAAAKWKPWLGRLLLTAACLLFSLWDSPAGFLVLCAGMVVTALTVQVLCGNSPRRRAAMVCACVYHIAVLMVFKYTGFFTGGAASIGWVPLGLSFFTFQQLWLLKESYTRQYEPVQGDDLILYAFFFPSVTSGPILRPNSFFPQLRSEKFLRPDWADIAAGLYGICCGTVKKVLLADALGVMVNNGWSRLADLTAPMAWMVMLGYTLQLYFDFSGYCDIAMGCGRLLGLRLPVNFNSPYHARSVGEFWKRWHMTLTTFLRECIYFPLGGSKKGAARTYLNILIVFLVSGFWHGAGWTFIVWGLLHGLAQVVERLLGKRLEKIPAAVRWCLTFVFINLAWVFFRAPDMASAMELLGRAVQGSFGLQGWLMDGVFAKEVRAIGLVLPAVKPWLSELCVLGLFGVGLLVLAWPRNMAAQLENFRPKWWQAVGLVVLCGWAILSFGGISTFIYSNF